MEKSLTLTFEGKTKTVKEWAEITGIDRQTLLQRHKKGWDTKRILTSPVIDRNCSNKNSSICWDCVHSIFSLERGTGCEKSIYGKPVPGWEAELRPIHGEESYRVKKMSKV